LFTPEGRLLHRKNIVGRAAGVSLTPPVHLVAHIGKTTRRDLGGTAVLGNLLFCCYFLLFHFLDFVVFLQFWKKLTGPNFGCRLNELLGNLAAAIPPPFVFCEK